MVARARILLADDDENLRELMKDTLENAGYRLIMAKNGDEALEKVYSESPDIMILDVNMPRLSGYEVCEKIRKDVLMRNLPIIMLTVKDTQKDEIKGLNLGVDDYITKPFKPAILLARIKSSLERVQQGVSVNPLTYLPGNTVIIKELEERLKKDEPFAVLYIDLDNFKAFNDYYGFQKGDDVIKETARIIISAVSASEPEGGFAGHIGGDDFIAVVSDRSKVSVCREIIEKFDNGIRKLYNEKDIKKGCIETENRRGEIESFPIMTISIGAVTSRIKEFAHVGEISRLGNELKKYAKKDKESSYVIDRRRNQNRDEKKNTDN